MTQRNYQYAFETEDNSSASTTDDDFESIKVTSSNAHLRWDDSLPPLKQQVDYCGRLSGRSLPKNILSSLVRPLPSSRASNQQSNTSNDGNPSSNATDDETILVHHREHRIRPSSLPTLPSHNHRRFSGPCSPNAPPKYPARTTYESRETFFNNDDEALAFQKLDPKDFSTNDDNIEGGNYMNMKRDLSDLTLAVETTSIQNDNSDQGSTRSKRMQKFLHNKSVTATDAIMATTTSRTKTNDFDRMNKKPYLHRRKSLLRPAPSTTIRPPNEFVSEDHPSHHNRMIGWQICIRTRLNAESLDDDSVSSLSST